MRREVCWGKPPRWVLQRCCMLRWHRAPLGATVHSILLHGFSPAAEEHQPRPQAAAAGIWRQEALSWRLAMQQLGRWLGTAAWQLPRALALHHLTLLDKLPSVSKALLVGQG